MKKNSYIQLALDLPFPASMSAEDFLITESNFIAVEFIRSWPKWHEQHALIIGEKKSGKKHLAHMWQEKSKALFCSLHPDAQNTNIDYHELLTAPNLHALILEYPSYVKGDPEKEEILFHLINRAKFGQLHLLMLDEQPPSRWRIYLKDLKSRLKAAPLYKIHAPDDLLLRALILKLCADRHMKITPEVLEYVSMHIDRNYEKIFNIVHQIDQYSLAKKRGVTIPLIREILIEKKIMK